MKEINKEKFEMRRKSGRYMLGFRYYGKSNSLQIISERNERPNMPEKMTDEDVIILSQLANQLAQTFNKMLIERDLVPDEFKKALEEGAENKEEEDNA